MKLPGGVVVDTNVATTANGANPGASPACVAACAEALQLVTGGHIYVDNAGKIVEEYWRNLRGSGEPGPGDAFFKWLLTHEWNPQFCTRVPLTPKAVDPTDYEELPTPTGSVTYDPSDRVFLAVSAAHPDRPAILQALDSKWWGWRESLAEIQVPLVFLCPSDIEALHHKKMGRPKKIRS